MIRGIMIAVFAPVIAFMAFSAFFIACIYFAHEPRRRKTARRDGRKNGKNR